MTIGPHPFTQLGIQQSIFQLGAQRATAASAAATGRSLSSFLGPAGAIAGGLFSVFGTLAHNRALKSVAEQQIGEGQRAIQETRVQRRMNSEALGRQLGAITGATKVANGMVRGTNAERIANLALQGEEVQIQINTNAQRTIDGIRQEQRLMAASVNSQMQNPIMSLISGSISGYTAGDTIYNLLAKKRKTEALADLSQQGFGARQRQGYLQWLASEADGRGLMISLNSVVDRFNRLEAEYQQLSERHDSLIGSVNQQLTGTAPAVQFKTFWGFR